MHNMVFMSAVMYYGSGHVFLDKKTGFCYRIFNPT